MDQSRRQHGQEPAIHPAVKATTIAALGGVLLVLSALTLAGTVIGLALVTPMLVIFSPVLGPAAIAGLLLASGFLSSGVFVVEALSVLVWMFQYLAGKQPVGADQIYQVRTAIAGQGREVSEHYGPGHSGA